MPSFKVMFNNEIERLSLAQDAQDDFVNALKLDERLDHPTMTNLMLKLQNVKQHVHDIIGLVKSDLLAQEKQHAEAAAAAKENDEREATADTPAEDEDSDEEDNQPLSRRIASADSSVNPNDSGSYANASFKTHIAGDSDNEEDSPIEQTIEQRKASPSTSTIPLKRKADSEADPAVHKRPREVKGMSGPPLSVDEVIGLARKAAAYLQTELGKSNEECLALVLCLPDRYGIGKADATLKAMKFDGTNMLVVKQAVKVWHEKLRKKLGERGDAVPAGKRIQAQRLLTGESLLVVTHSLSPEFNKALLGLLATAIHPVFGIDGKKVDKMCVPQYLPASLQPKLPKLPCRECNAAEINELLQAIFECMNGSHCDGAVKAFVELHELNTETGRSRFGLPRTWNENMGFVTTCPEGRRGDVLAWEGLHATIGSDGTNCVSFLDMVQTDFIGEEQMKWYEFATNNAPVDPGAGSGRGSWLSLEHAVKQGRQSFGISTDGWEKQGKNILTDEQREQFHGKGYLILEASEIPETLRPLADTSCRNFEAFFKNVSGYPLNLSATDGEGSANALFDSGLSFTGSKMIDPLNPFDFEGIGQKSKNAQG